jgi:MarR family 2-MHQ and catechol resistance regulon transcriptional repressor
MTPCQTQQSARSPSLSPEGNGLGLLELLRLVSRCERELRRTLADRIRRWDISDVELLVLRLCHEAAEPGIAQSELVAEVDVSAAQMSGLVDRLRRQELLVARRCDSDRRKQYWRLTGKGNRLLDEIQADLSAVSLGLAKNLSVDERGLLASLLHRLSRTAGQPLSLRAVVPDTNDLGQHRDVHNDNTEHYS